uniref:CRAL-TRIO domain-containing protein n=1 Tax=Photinus pyralis TaxID=7054 RepID=A0A1Y1KR22_PHOPY
MVRVLCAELQNVAIQQLNENPTNISDCLDRLRDWAFKQPHLKVKLDDQWLLTLLRCCKFSLERTKMRIDLLCTMKTMAPELFKNRDPFLPELQDLLSMGCILPLRKEDDPAAPRTILIRMLKRATEHRVNDGFKLILMTFEILMIEDDNFIISGSKVLEDHKELSLKHIQMVTPTVIKDALTFLKSAYPVKANSFHIINAPDLFAKAFDLVKPFISEKTVKKVYVHTDESFDEVIPSSILPMDYGGTGGKITDLIVEWKLKVESYRDWFMQDYEFRSDESKRAKKPIPDGLFGLDGSFRNLDID